MSYADIERNKKRIRLEMAHGNRVSNSIEQVVIPGIDVPLEPEPEAQPEVPAKPKSRKLRYAGDGSRWEDLCGEGLEDPEETLEANTPDEV